MQYTTFVTVLFSLPALSMAGACPAAYVFKTTLTTEKCSQTTAQTAGCQSACCKKDATKCVNYFPMTCATGMYSIQLDEATKAGDVAAADATAAKTACCKAVATCKDFTCPAGYEKAANKTDATKCPSNAASCLSECCAVNKKTCGGTSSITCDAAKYNPKATFVAAKNAAALASWMGQTTNATGAADCCLIKATCAAATYTCGAGMKKKAAGTCATNDASCALSCCEADDKTCGGLPTLTCNGTRVKGTNDFWKGTVATAATFDTACCAAAPKCAAVTCASGMKKKANVSALTCPTQDTTSQGCGGVCCEADEATCGGLAMNASNVCDTATMFRSDMVWVKATAQADRDTWNNKAATKDTFKTECCTKRSTCDAFKKYVAPGGMVAGSQQVHPTSFLILASLYAFASQWMM